MHTTDLDDDLTPAELAELATEVAEIRRRVERILKHLTAQGRPLTGV